MPLFLVVNEGIFEGFTRRNYEKCIHVFLKEISFKGQIKPEPCPERSPFSDRHPQPFYKRVPLPKVK